MLHRDHSREGAIHTAVYRPSAGPTAPTGAGGLASRPGPPMAGLPGRVPARSNARTPGSTRRLVAYVRGAFGLRRISATPITISTITTATIAQTQYELDGELVLVEEKAIV